jgi:hypothetical protein
MAGRGQGPIDRVPGTAARSGAVQTWDPGYTEVNRDHASAVHRKFVAS